MPARKTHEQFVKELKIINPNIEVLGKYINTKTKIKCKIKNKIFWTTPDSLLSKHKFSFCGTTKRLTNNNFKKRVYKINQNIEILSKYVNLRVKIRCKCKIDGHEWDALPDNIIHNKSGCPMCANNIKYTQETFINKMKDIDFNIKILSDFKNKKTKIKVKNIKCGHYWETTPASLLTKKGCPVCNRSRGERQKEKILEKYNIKYETQKKI